MCSCKSRFSQCFSKFSKTKVQILPWISLTRCSTPQMVPQIMLQKVLGQNQTMTKYIQNMVVRSIFYRVSTYFPFPILRIFSPHRTIAIPYSTITWSSPGCRVARRRGRAAHRQRRRGPHRGPTGGPGGPAREIHPGFQSHGNKGNGWSISHRIHVWYIC